jgi:hypothetical protein
MSAKRMPITTLEDLKQAIDSVVRYNWDDEVADYIFNCSDEPGDNQRSGHILHALLALRNWVQGTAYTLEDLEDLDETTD